MCVCGGGGGGGGELKLVFLVPNPRPLLASA